MRRTNKTALTAILLVVGVFASFDLKTLAAANPQNRQAGLWGLLGKAAAQQAATTSIRAETRIVHLPQDHSIGRAYIVEPQFDKKPLYHYALGWPNRMIPEVRGDIEVPAGKILRLDIMKDARTALPALRQLKGDDVQILFFYHAARNVDDLTLEAIAHLSGLRVLFAENGSFSENGLRHLAGFRELAALHFPASVPVESLDYLKGLTSLEYLNISGQEMTEAKLAKAGELPWLTQLSIAGHNASGGLKHIAKLKSLRYLNLAAVRDPGLDMNLAHIAGLTDLEEINFEDSFIGDAGLSHLRNMKKLKKLDLFSNPNTGRITDAGIAHLKTLTALEEVRLCSQCLTDSGIVHLAELDSLKKLNLWSTRLTDTGVAVVARMKSLEELDVMCQSLTDAGFAGLCLCPSLKSLSINRCKVGDGGLAHLAKLRSLEYFAIDNAPVAGNGLASLKQCPSLRELALYFLDLDDRAISHIAAVRSLEKLRLYHIGVKITDETLNQLGSLTALKTLSIIAEDASQMPISDEGIGHLSRLPNLECIRLNHCENVTDKGLGHLEGLASLRELRLDNCRVTTAGADRLKEKIPGVSLTVPATMRAAGIRLAASPPVLRRARPLDRAGQDNSTRNAPRRRR